MSFAAENNHGGLGMLSYLVGFSLSGIRRGKCAAGV